MRTQRSLLLLCITLSLALAASADQHPNRLKGFTADAVYSVHDIDSVNVFNGNLTMTIPIGQEYPVSEGLSYHLALYSNANLWDSQVVHSARGTMTDLWADNNKRTGAHAVGACDESDGQTVALPDRRGNAGMGWTLTLGRLYPSGEPSRGGQGGWLYESPDGAEHVFGEHLHDTPGEVAGSETTALYTGDESYLRLEPLASYPYSQPSGAHDHEHRRIDFPDGTYQIFRPHPNGRGPWLPERLGKLGSAGWVTITYPSNGDGTFNWVIADSTGRQHTLHFAKMLWDGGWKAVVSSVDLAAFGSQRAVYQFNYHQANLGRPFFHEDCAAFRVNARVQMLDSVVLPTGSGEGVSRYAFTYYESGDNSDEQGLPRSVTLPTGAVVSWDYLQYAKPTASADVATPYFAYSWGVFRRHLRKSASENPFATWIYTGFTDGNYLPDDGTEMPRELKQYVVDPRGNVTVSYFSVAPEDYQDFKGYDYGKPFTRHQYDETGKFLSRQEYAPVAAYVPPAWNADATTLITGPPALGSLLRSTYVKYDAATWKPVPVTLSRVAENRVLHADGQWIDTIHEDFDGLGHYRKTTVKGSFGFGGVEKSVVTNYNPTRGSFPNSFTNISPTDPWLTGMYNSVVTTQVKRDISGDPIETTSATTTHCFDASTGRLQATRAIRGGSGADLLTVFKDTNNDGDVDQELYFGGDESGYGIPTDVCQASSGYRYRINVSHSAGVQSKSWYEGKDFTIFDLDVDVSTGLPSASYTASGLNRALKPGVRTDYQYNALGQITAVKPDGEAWTRYAYLTDPVNTPGGRVIATQWPSGSSGSGTPLTEERHYYDTLGRLIQSRKRLPGTAERWSVSELHYDNLGRKEETTVAVEGTEGEHQALSPTTPVTKLVYDALGRVRSTTLPDGSVSETRFGGVRTVNRSSRIATEEGPETLVWNAEEYDALGRLVKVRENTTENLGGNAQVITDYAYDHGDRLKLVSSGVQTRTFTYDGAGLLTQDQQPESGVTRYKYDARGHALEVKKANDSIILTTSYDSAERVQNVTHVGVGVLKEFTYDTAPGAGMGKIATATRHNRHADLPGGDVTVTESFTYNGRGRLSEKTTSVSTGETFTDKYAYDERGDLDEITYPSCSVCPERKVTQAFDRGLLRSVSHQLKTGADFGPEMALADDFQYHANGLLLSMTHKNADGSNGPKDKQTVAANGMPRPASISFEDSCPKIEFTVPNDLTVASNEAVPLAVENAPAGATFEWFRNAETSAFSTAASVSVQQSATTKYWVRVRSGACFADSRVITLTVAGVCVPVALAPMSDINVQSPHDVTLQVTTTAGTGPFTYQWYEGPLGNTGNPVSTSATPVIANVSTSRSFWVHVTNCHGASAADRAVNIVFSCGPQGSFAITASPAEVAQDAAFQLQAPQFDNATYSWYRGTYSEKTLLGTTTSPTNSYSIAAGISAPTQYFVEVQVSGCNPTPVASTYKTMTPCMKPQAQTIRSESRGEGLGFNLSVDAEEGVSYRWYEGATGETTHPLGTERTQIVGNESKRYWVRMTRVCGSVTTTTDADSMIIDAGCMPFVFRQPADGNAVMPALGGNGNIAVSAKAGGTGPFTYQWYEVSGSATTPIAGATGDSYTWSYQVPSDVRPVAVQKLVFLEVRQGSYRIQSRTAKLTFAQLPQRIANQTGGDNLFGTERAELEVFMEPPPDATHVYTYEWYKANGTPNGERISGNASSRSLSTDSIDVFWVKIHGQHGPVLTGYSEDSISEPMTVTRYGTCEASPLRVEQSVNNLCDGAAAPLVTYRAVSDDRDVTYQWYEGLSGDTRETKAADSGKPNELTVNSGVLRPYWVRAMRECGAYSDSATLYVSQGACAPVVFDQHIASTEVGWNGTATLSAPALTGGTFTYTWYKVGQATNVGTGATLTIPNVQQSARYWVRIRNTNCSTSTDSYPALVRVSSATGMTPPAWQTTRWTDKNAPLTLDATTTGAVGYQWYEGEVSDVSHPIGGATLATYNTSLTADAQYWVRVLGSGGSLIDSPILTVRVCTPPELTGPLSLERNIIKGQRVVFSIPARGTDLEYQWYRGVSGDESHPIGSHVDRMYDSPQATTDYWVRVTSHCGEGGTDTRPMDSATFTANVCPTVDAPTAAADTVMPNKSTTLTVTAVGNRLTYRWYIGESGDISHPIANSNSASISTGNLTQTTMFWCQVSSGTCATPSPSVTVSVCEVTPIAFVSVNAKVRRNVYQGVTVFTYNHPMLVDVYEGETGDVEHSTLIHSGSNTFGISPLVTTKYWARGREEGSVCYSDTPTLTVQVCVPQITAQPQSAPLDKVTNPSATATLSVTADITPVTYQWYVGQAGDTSAPVASATNSSLTISPNATTTYWVRVSGSCGYHDDSEAATITLCQAPAITTQPAGTISAAGASRALHVGATGTELTYRWYRGVSGDTSNPLASTSEDITVAPSTTTDYWVRVSGRCGAAVDSNTAKVSIPPTINTQPVGAVVMPGTTRTLTVAAGGTQLGYQWYKASPESLIPGATAASYTPPAPTVATSYYCRVTSGNAYTTTDVVTLSLCPTPTLGWTSVNREVRPSYYQTVGITGLDPETEYTVQWYRGQSGDVSQPISAAGVLGISPTVTTSYWVRVTAVATGCVADSATLTVQVCVPEITTQPVASTTLDKVTNPSATVTLSVAADVPVTYQWYLGQPGVTSNPIAGATSSSYVASPSSDTTYWVRLTSACGRTVNSNAAVVTLCQPPQITRQPSNHIVTPNYNLNLSIDATGSGLTYRWYKGPSGTTTTPLGSTSNEITVNTNVTADYWVRVTGQCGVVDSAAGKVSVAPAITAQPVGASVTVNSTRTLSVTVTGTQLTYQWYRWNGSTETAMSGATAASFVTPPITSDVSYFCRIYSGLAAVNSDIVTLSVCQPHTIGANGATLISGNAVTLVVSDPVAGETYEWYRGSTGDTSNPIGIGSTRVVNPLETTLYWMRTKRATCDADSTTLTVRICRPKITAQPQSATINPNTQRTLTVTATGTSPMTYQWYAGTTGTTSNPIAGATSASYTTPALTASANYWVRILCPSAGCGATNADSDTAVVTVCAPPAITSQPANRNITSSMTINISVTATGDGLHYQWYEGAAGNTSTPRGTDSNVLTIKPTTTKSYWVRVTGNCGTVDSVAALQSVYPTIGTQPTDATICSLGDTVSFSVAASGTNLTYRWYRRVNNGAPVEVGNGTTSLSIAVTATPVQFWCDVTSGNAPTSSNVVTVTVNPHPTLNSLTKTLLSAGRWRLNANVYSADQPLVQYKWYQGALGTTTTQLYDGAYPNIQVVPSTTPMPYWVRVYYTDTGCYTDAGINVQ